MIIYYNYLFNNIIIIIFKNNKLNFFIYLFIYNYNYIILIKNYKNWGLGIGDWGLGIGDWAQSPIPNPQPN